ncbi:MAG: hypothetical protein FWF51_12320 [Chitinivibrionia bacterium]|nr:hypothetical protein [Chitinivibrionia bacterium]
MTKKTLVFFVICIFAHFSAFGQKILTIDEAIFEGMNYVQQNTSQGTKVAVLNVESENGDLGEYILVECKNHIANNTFLSLANTKKLPEILREKKIADLNIADDNTLSEVAGAFGAEFAIQGKFFEQAGNYNLIFRILNVEQSRIVGMQSYEIQLDEILATLLGVPFQAEKKLEGAEKELEELKKQMRALQEKNDSALAALEAKTAEEQSVRERLEAEAEAARLARQSQIEAKTKKDGGAKFVFSFRPEYVSGTSVSGAGASIELGGITQNSFYFTGELSGGGIYGGLAFNIGGCANKDGAVKNVFGISAGLRNMLYYIEFTENGQKFITEGGSNISIFGGFWKLMFGDANNFDITNKILFGFRKNPIDYDKNNREVIYEESFNATYILSIGYTLTKSKK